MVKVLGKVNTADTRPAKADHKADAKMQRNRKVELEIGDKQAALDKKKLRKSGKQQLVVTDDAIDDRNDSLDSCANCGNAVSESHLAVKCDGCGYWHHTYCEQITDEVYSFLCDHDDQSLHWMCRKCTVLFRQLFSSITRIDEAQKRLEEKFDAMMNKLEDVGSVSEAQQGEALRSLEELKTKSTVEADDELLKTIEDRLMKLEHRPTVIEEAQQRLELKVDQLRSNIEEPVVLAVQDAIQQDKAEEVEIEKRKANVTVHGIAESQDQSPEQRTADDIGLLSVMFHEAGVENIQVEHTVRLGKKATDSAQNPRPFKVVLDSVDSKVELLKKAKNLRLSQEGGWSTVFVHQDLTPKQREARKPLVAQLKARKAQGKQNLIIFNRKVVRKRGSQPSQVS